MQFADFAAAHGLIIRSLNDDGRTHRVPTEDHPKKRNGAYMFDGHSGWVQNWAVHEKAIAWRHGGDGGVPNAPPKRDMQAARRREAEERAAAAAAAQQVIARCSYDTHPYLAKKGFPDQRGLIDTDGRLVIPMRNMRDYQRVTSLQWIPESGKKLFLKNGEASGAGFSIGVGRESWIVEGYATGLSVRSALEKMHRQARVIVCFSAGNIPKVAEMVGGRRFVMADNDQSGTGCRVATATGLPWTMPPVVGEDANDFHMREGIHALIVLMRELFRNTK
jgi:putative DNA primase/helicase